jgi:anti-anti-sigma factor
MHTSTKVVNGRAVISLQGRFDFSAHRDFRNSCHPTLAAADICELEVDLGRVEYLDSSALGMLLLLKERADEMKKRVVLSHCQGAVRQALQVANFDKIFSLA